ncbi:MAG TPA: hypothetical protein VN285_11270 [Candidatus Deferrimicrobium sp.]|nr:hypothetical protein [Candidatus Deferrimicrobium sp.]
MYTGMNDFCTGNSLLRITPGLLICTIALSCSEPSPPGVGVYLKNPGEEFEQLQSYDYGEANVWPKWDDYMGFLGTEKIQVLDAELPLLKYGGKIYFQEVPLDFSRILLGSNIRRNRYGLLTGTTKDVPLTVKKIKEGLYSIELPAGIPGGGYYLNNESPGFRRAWFFNYDNSTEAAAVAKKPSRSVLPNSRPSVGGVFLKNPGEQYVPVMGYSPSDLKVDEMGEYPQGMPKMLPGGMIVFYKEPLDSYGVYLGTKFNLVWSGALKLPATIPVRKVDDETYVWDSEMLEGKVCAGLWYVFKAKSQSDSKVWFFCYDDLSGIPDFLGEWGQAKDYKIRRESAIGGDMRGALVDIYMEDCRLYVRINMLIRTPAKFSDGQIAVSWPQSAGEDPIKLILAMDRATGELVVPDGICYVEGKTLRLKRYVDTGDEGESAVTRQAQQERQRQQQEAGKH